MNQHDNIILKTSITGRRQPGVIIARICRSDTFNISIANKQSSFIKFSLLSSILLSKWKFVRNIRKSIKMVLAIPMFGYDHRNRDVFISRDFHHWHGGAKVAMHEWMSPVNYIINTISAAKNIAISLSKRATGSVIHKYLRETTSLVHEAFRNVPVMIEQNRYGSLPPTETELIASREQELHFRNELRSLTEGGAETFNSSLFSNIIRLSNLKQLQRIDRHSSDSMLMRQYHRSSLSGIQSFLSKLFHHTTSVSTPVATTVDTLHFREPEKLPGIATSIMHRLRIFTNSVLASHFSLATKNFRPEHFIAAGRIYDSARSTDLRTEFSFPTGEISGRTSLTYGPGTNVTAGNHLPMLRPETRFFPAQFPTGLQSTHSLKEAAVTPGVTVYGVASTDRNSAILSIPATTAMWPSVSMKPVHLLRTSKSKVYGRLSAPVARTAFVPVSTTFQHRLTMSNRTEGVVRLLHGKSTAESISTRSENTHAYQYDHFPADQPDLHYTRLPIEFDENGRTATMTQPSDINGQNIAAKSTASRKPKGIADFPSNENAGNYRISELADKVAVIIEEKYQTEAKRKGLL